MDKRFLAKLDAGVYCDEDGGLHLDVAELLDAAGFKATKANQAALVQAARDVYAAEGADVVEVDDG